MSRCVLRAVVALYLAAVCLVGLSSSAWSEPEIEIEIGSAVHYPGETCVPLHVYLRNYVDTVAGFQFMFTMDRPNAVGFCDKVDTVGTLAAGWEYLDVGLMGGPGWVCNVVGLAEFQSPYTNRGIPPQDGDRPLFNLLLFVPDHPDLVFGDTVLLAACRTLNCFSLSSPDGQLIGVDTVVVIDTAYYICTQWQDAICVDSQRVPEGAPYNFIVVDTTVVPVIDTSAIHWNTGMVVVHPLCGDIDGSVDGVVTMDDLTLLIDHLFISLAPLRWPVQTNVDGSEDHLVTMSDLTRMIDHLFITLSPLYCLPE